MKRIIAVTAALLASTTFTVAQDYPTGQVNLIVPFGPGASNDAVARYLANQLRERWDQPVVVENRPGAGSTIGTEYVARADPDGLTLLFTSSAYTTAPAVFAELPYDPLIDLIPITMVGFSQFIMVGGSNVQSEDLASFIEEAKTREIFLATAGLGSATHFAGELFSAASGVEVTPVHYRGGAELTADLLGGRMDIYVGSLATLVANVRNGNLKALAVMGDEPAEALPDVMTTASAGIDGASTGLWFGVFAPAGTPDDVVAKLNADINDVMASDGAREFMAGLESVSRGYSQEEFGTLVEREIEQWKTLAQERGIEAN
ncbi:MAG: hypothetical protein MEP57_07890 [Microvirga sp.]|nr:hypothetical protein [Microvirga sp.]